MRFGLIANLKRTGAKEAIETFIDWALRTGNRLVLCDELEDLPDRTFQFANRKDIPNMVDIVVSMGGDGTLLAAARQAAPVGTPVLGINLGSLGFLTQIQPPQLLEALDGIMAGDYAIAERMMLHTEIVGKPKLSSPFALNDVVIDNGPVARLIDINLLVDGERVVNYRADGLVLATPTGSTAYNLAAGGPIVHPRMEAIVASPISSFSLSTRPMILPPDSRLEMRIHSPHDVAGLTLDGQIMAPLMGDDVVIVTKANFSLKFIRFPETSFYEVLTRKLHWGRAPENK